jgi:tRNA A37 methylthiotransferase MiaB
VYKPRRDGAASFAQLLDAVAAVDPEMRIRFTSPHPKDFADDVLQVGGQGLCVGAASLEQQ